MTFQLSCAVPPRVAGLKRHLFIACRRVDSKKASLVAFLESLPLGDLDLTRERDTGRDGPL